MAENVLQTTKNDNQIGSQVAPSIDLQESDNPQKERIDLTGNKGINHDILNSDMVINDGGVKTMVENVLQTTNDDQIGSQVAPSIDLQESDNPQKEKIDLNQTVI